MPDLPLNTMQAPSSGMDADERAMVQEAAEVEEAISRAAAMAAALPLLPPPSAMPPPRAGPSAAPDTGPEEEEAVGGDGENGDGDDVAMDEGDDEEDADAPVRVVKNYVRADPRAAANRPYDPTQMMVSPITGMWAWPNPKP